MPTRSSAILIIVAILFFITDCLYAQDFPSPDLNTDGLVDFTDYTRLALNWHKAGVGLQGDFDEGGIVDSDDLAYFAYHWLTEQWKCEKIDITPSGMIDFVDFVRFADAWLSDTNDINWDPYCDFDDSNMIDFCDLRDLCYCWLSGSRPEDIFESFKAALVAGNIDEAITYFIDFVADDYKAIFTENIGKLQNMVDDMGELSLESIDEGIAIYEISNGTGTQFYPVVFTLDDDGNWKISKF